MLVVPNKSIAFIYYNLVVLYHLFISYIVDVHLIYNSNDKIQTKHQAFSLNKH
jgi:hypothetical protein